MFNGSYVFANWWRLGYYGKVGSCNKIFSCASVRGVLKTHMLLLLVTSPVASVWTVLMVSILCSDLLFTPV